MVQRGIHYTHILWWTDIWIYKKWIILVDAPVIIQFKQFIQMANVIISLNFRTKYKACFVTKFVSRGTCEIQRKYIY